MDGVWVNIVFYPDCFVYVYIMNKGLIRTTNEDAFLKIPNVFIVFGHILRTYQDWYIFLINSTTNYFLNCFPFRVEPLHHFIYCNHKIGHYHPHRELSLCSLISHNLSVLTFFVSQCNIHTLSPTKFNLYSLFTPLTVLILSPSSCLHQDFLY